MMNRKSSLIVLILLTTVFSLSFAQKHTKEVKPAVKSILILKDSSDLEISVSRIISDSLTKIGYKVKETDFADVNNEKASAYYLSIVFSAMNPGNEIDSRVQKFISTKSGTSKVFLYTVYGNIYNQTDTTVDATTQATQALHPQLIANHILRSLKL